MKVLLLALFISTAVASDCELPQKVDQPLHDLVAVSDHVIPACNVRALLNANKALFPPSQEIIRLPHGKGSFINPFYTGEPSVTRPEEIGPTILKEWRIKRLAHEPQRSLEEIQSLFEKVRTLMLSQLSQSPMSEAQKNLMMNRMSKVAFKYQPDNCGAPAWYTMTTHTISFCPLAKTLPEYALVTLISHELGHELDLCSLSSPFYKIGTPAPRFASPPLEDQNVSDVLNSNTSGYILSTTSDSPGDRALFQTMVTDGRLSLSDQGIPRSLNPTLPVYECLSRSTTGYTPIAANDNDSCGNTTHTETSAQTYGARSVSAYMRAYPPSSKLEALSMMIGSLPTSFKNSMVDGKESDMNNLYFDSASVQDALECRPDSRAAKCMSEFGSNQSQPK